jgi:hypothetical protein
MGIFDEALTKRFEAPEVWIRMLGVESERP